jgi:hypothetical protein
VEAPFIQESAESSRRGTSRKGDQSKRDQSYSKVGSINPPMTSEKRLVFE